MRSLLSKNHSVFFLWTGQGISSIGSIVYSMALSWYVINETKSPFVMGTVLLVGLLPRIVFSIISGVFGDRISKKKFILSIDLLRFIITFVWGVSLFYHSFNIVEVYIYTFVLSLIDAVFNPIYNAILPEVANTDNLSRLVSINQMVFKIASILAPTFAGIAIIKLQFNQFIILNSITFLIAALFTLPIKYENKNQTIQKKASPFDHLKSGLKYFWGNKIIFWSVVLISFANIAVVSYNVNLVNMIQNDLNLSANVYGVVLTFYSAGSFLINLLLSVYKIKKFRGYIYLTSLCVAGLLYTTVFFVKTPFLLYIIFFLVGSSFTITSYISTLILYELSLEEYRSRVLGIASISTFLSPVGFLVWGIVGDVMKSSSAIGLAGCIIMLIAFFGFTTSIKEY